MLSKLCGRRLQSVHRAMTVAYRLGSADVTGTDKLPTNAREYRSGILDTERSQIISTNEKCEPLPLLWYSSRRRPSTA